MEKSEKHNLIIDNHSHVTLPINNHIKLMNEAGIDKIILFRTLVHPEKQNSVQGIKHEMKELNLIHSGNPSLAKKRAKEAEQELYDAIAEYPDRFIGFGAVLLNLAAEEMVDYIETNIIAKGFVGLGEFTMSSGQIFKLEPVL